MTIAAPPLSMPAVATTDPFPSFHEALQTILRDRNRLGGEERRVASFPDGVALRFQPLRFLTPRVGLDRLQGCIGRANADPISWVGPGQILIERVTVLQSKILWECTLSLDEPFAADRAFFGF